MGTRSTIHIYCEFTGEPLVCIYQQYDGYIDGVGHQLADWLKGRKYVNGFSGHQHAKDGYVNGMQCLAAQLIKHLKKDIGHTYITNVGSSQEFDYRVYWQDEQFKIVVDHYGDHWEGSPEELLQLETINNDSK